MLPKRKGSHGGWIMGGAVWPGQRSVAEWRCACVLRPVEHPTDHSGAGLLSIGLTVRHVLPMAPSIACRSRFSSCSLCASSSKRCLYVVPAQLNTEDEAHFQQAIMPSVVACRSAPAILWPAGYRQFVHHKSGAIFADAFGYSRSCRSKLEMV